MTAQIIPFKLREPKFTAVASMHAVDDTYIVSILWKSDNVVIDRPVGEGWVFKATQRRLAERLVKCIDAQGYLGKPILKRDKFGASYVHVHWDLIGRHMNADLKRRGF